MPKTKLIIMKTILPSTLMQQLDKSRVWSHGARPDDQTAAASREPQWHLANAGWQSRAAAAGGGGQPGASGAGEDPMLQRRADLRRPGGRP